MQEQEEGHQHQDIAACRERFYVALARVQMAIGDAGEQYVVYFTTNNPSLAEAQMKTLMGAAVVAKSGLFQVQAKGHADTTGNEAVNGPLSKARAETVKLLLISAGVKADQIEATHYGATRPVVKTGPGTPEPKNRRVEIRLVR